MRALPVLVAVAVAAQAVPSPALAQDTDMPGCIQANPCEVVVDLSAQGITLEQSEFTRGDWILLSVFNGDDVEHTLTVAGRGVSVRLGPDDLNDSRPFELSTVGKVTLQDSPSGDTADLTVLAEESFSGTGTKASSKGSPGLAPLAALAALAAAVAVASRRRD